MDSECIFCRIIRKELPSAVVYQNEDILSFLDISPIAPGHCLVIPKKHFARLEDCPPSLIAKLTQNLGHIAQGVIQAVSAQDYNILNNNGRNAGQLVDHLHFHIIPRKPNDGVFNRWPAGEYPAGQMDQLAEKIRQILS
jgi:histidine triad (HIT) family protein